MPESMYFGPQGATFVAAVENGSLPESRVTDMATRVIASWYQLGQDSGYSPLGVGSSKSVLMDGAIEGHVLVKNVNNALPLNRAKILSIFGYDAPSTLAANVSDPVLQPEGSGWSVGASSTNLTMVGDAVAGRILTSEQAALGGTIVTGGGAGSNVPPYISAPFDAINEQAYKDDTALFWHFKSQNPVVNNSTDACLVFINAFATEGADRAGILIVFIFLRRLTFHLPENIDDYSDDLNINIASNFSNTIVVIHNAGVRLVDKWISHPNVTATIFALLPGQDSGRALVQILYGFVSPSGKLPYTAATQESDYSVSLPAAAEGDWAMFPQSNFTEGIFIDYTQFDKQKITPRYELGYGLTYTTFDYSDLSINPTVTLASTTELPQNRAILPGGNPELWDILVKITAKVRNTGKFPAKEVAQLYVGIPGNNAPVKQLRGFDKHATPINDEATFIFELTRRDLSVWDVAKQDWVLQRGEYQIYVGSSSRILPLKGKLVI